MNRKLYTKQKREILAARFPRYWVPQRMDEVIVPRSNKYEYVTPGTGVIVRIMDDIVDVILVPKERFPLPLGKKFPRQQFLIRDIRPSPETGWEWVYCESHSDHVWKFTDRGAFRYVPEHAQKPKMGRKYRGLAHADSSQSAPVD